MLSYLIICKILSIEILSVSEYVSYNKEYELIMSNNVVA